MVLLTLETGIFGLISEGQLMARIRKSKSTIKEKKSRFWVANPKFMDKARKKCPVSANVKSTAFIK
jgi:hypothetical protein